MLVNVKYITLAALFVVVASQTPSPCILQCSQAALGSASNKSCTAYTDPCVCTDLGFQAADGTCLQANCTAADQAAALQLQQILCGSGSNTTTTDTSAASSSASTSTAGTSTVTSASGTSMSGSMTMSGSSATVPTTKSSGTGTGSSSASSPSKSSGANTQAEFRFFTLGVAAAGTVVGSLLL